ncbi:hypothetical protein ABZ915_39810 [Streptomyces sp. NPDC046915]|uniref:hypothetical protein n=1 Tax=Streptomyces sp. NPDC046915 TaxID=3155257 RepID=UPI0033CEBA74
MGIFRGQDAPHTSLRPSWSAQRRQRQKSAAARAMVNIRRVVDGGIVTEVTTRELRGPATGQIVEETVEDRTVPDCRADAGIRSGSTASTTARMAWWPWRSPA